MDVNAVLARARQAVRDMASAPNPGALAEASRDLADSFEAVDEWLSKGGFLPADWEAHRRPATGRIAGRG